MMDRLREYHSREATKQPSGHGGGGGGVGGGGGGSGGQFSNGRPAKKNSHIDKVIADQLNEQQFGEQKAQDQQEDGFGYMPMPDAKTGPAEAGYDKPFEWSTHEKEALKTAESFKMEKVGSGQEAMEKARSMVYNVGPKNGVKRAPIKPVGVATRKAISVAQAMIERLSTVDDDERVQQDEYLYDTKRLMKLDINPMRGIRSAKVGRSKAPVAIFVDYSGSCDHVAALFGMIMVGFANEGATVLIGGNGTVESVYHPFPNRPLEDYAADVGVVTRIRGRHRNNVTVKAGYLASCPSTGLDKFKLRALIACTDSHSQEELLARKAFDTHVIYAVESEEYNKMRNSMRGGRMTEEAAKAYGGDYAYIYQLGFHQHVHVVSDMESLVEAMQTGR